MDSKDFEGNSGVSPEEAANWLLNWYEERDEQPPSGKKVRMRIMIFNESCLAALGFHLAVLSYLWPRLKEREKNFYVTISPEFEADREAMGRLLSVTSYLEIPSERIRSFEEVVRLGVEEIMQKYTERYSKFMQRCAERTFNWSEGGPPLN